MPQTAIDTHLNLPSELHIDLSVLSVEPADAYHARAGEYLSSHQLLDFMACPKLYQKKRLGLIEEADSAAFLLGEATHCRILEGRDAFESRFAVGGPINPQKNKPYGKDTKAFRDWAKGQSKSGIHYDDLPLIENLASGVAAHEDAAELLLHGRSEGVVRTDYCDTPCQIRIDWLHPNQGIVDLKTTADLDRFAYDAVKLRYNHQLAFYQAVLAQVIDQFVPVYLIAVEKKEPFRCGVWRVSDQSLADARSANEQAIHRLRRAWELDEFPTGYEVVRVLEFP